VTIIEIRPFRNGWQVYESPGVQSVFLIQEQAIDYAQGRACFRSGEIRILDSNGAVERTTTNARLDAVTFMVIDMVIAERDSRFL
jgi:hypothetical protein